MKTAIKHLQSKASTIAVFDSGIGSYSIVETIKRRAEQQDVLYFADRKSFPYGSKTPEELFRVVSKAIRFLETYKPSAIVIASNVPSVTIMPQLKLVSTTPLYGVLPPIQEAMQISHSKNVGVLGVKSLVTHPSVRDYIATQTDTPHQVYTINASSLVDKVESGEFLFNESSTEDAIRNCIDKSLDVNPQIDTFTLSSTHLPWLAKYFARLYPQYNFIDPAKSVVASLPLKNDGTGKISGFATVGTSTDHSQENFDKMLNALGIKIDIKWVDVDKVVGVKSQS